MSLRQVCPSCHATDLTHEVDAWRCQQCGMVFNPPSVACPNCGAINAPDDDACTSCGRSLTLVDQVLDRHTSARTPGFLAAAREQASTLKETEQRASEARHQEFVEIDRRREAAQAAQELARRKSDRALLAFGIALGAVVLAGACLFGLVLRG